MGDVVSLSATCQVDLGVAGWFEMAWLILPQNPPLLNREDVFFFGVVPEVPWQLQGYRFTLDA
jgi:hypothetical protein